MKKIIVISSLLALVVSAHSQTLYLGNTTTLYVHQPNTSTATLHVNGSIQNEGVISDNGRIDMSRNFTNNGLLKGNGIISVGGTWTSGSAATTAPGNSPGSLVMMGDFETDASTLEIEIGGITAGVAFDQMTVGGTADVSGGVLDVAFIGGYTPVGGEVYKIIDAGTLTGVFATENLPTLPSGLSWTVDYDYAAADLKLIISSVLPVELVSFYGIKHEGKTKLTWRTETEVNADNFEVERSGDGLIFENIGQVSARGYGSTYIYWDEEPLLGMNYYRLKMNDLDRSFEYSNVVAVRFEEAGEVSIFPNPTRHYFIVSISQSQDTEVDIRICDALGQLVSTVRKITSRGDSFQQEIDVQDWPRGIYYVTVKAGEGEAVTHKLVVD